MSRSWDDPNSWKAPITKHGYSDGGDSVPAPFIGSSARNPNCRQCHRHKRGWKDVPGCSCEKPDFDQMSDRIEDRRAFVGFLTEIMRETLRVLKPGGHMLVWSIPRTAHWTATAIEDAGFEIRDTIHHLKDRGPDVRTFLESLSPEQQELLARAEPSDSVMLHLFGQGFPKSLNIGKAIDKMAGAEREVTGVNPNHRAESGVNYKGVYAGGNTGAPLLTAPATPEAKTWDGWGTALKPAVEMWILARKPIEAQNVASQVLRTGTGAINIDGSRIGSDGGETHCTNRNAEGQCLGHNKAGCSTSGATVHGPDTSGGRYPSNLVLSHSPGCMPGDCESGCPVQALDEQSGVLHSAMGQPSVQKANTASVCFNGRSVSTPGVNQYGNTGGASRFFKTFDPDPPTPFFYTGKASRADKNADLAALNPMMQLRDDITEEDRLFVLAELHAAGVVF